MAKCDVYLQVEPSFFRHVGQDGRPRVHSIRTQRVTQKRPSNPLPGSVVVKLTLDIPDEAFLPLAPAAVVEIPLSHTSPVAVSSEPVEVLPSE